MRVTEKTNYPNLAKEFRNQLEIAELIHCSDRTVRRSMSGNRPFQEYEIRMFENYTGKSREYLLRRAGK